MKIFVKVNKPTPNARCDEHKTTPSTYALDIESFGQHIKRNACDLCVCSHLNLQTYFSVQQGLVLPKGLWHK